MSTVHFLRPEWLWGILLVLLICALSWYQVRHRQKQHNLINPKLLPFLLLQKGTERLRGLHILALLLSGISLCIALAGPSFNKQPVPTFQNKAGLVIALDLSLSMTAADVSPSRLERAKFKIRDILNSERDEAIGLIAWAGDAHSVAPLTQDYKTLQALLPALDPYIMPAYGSNLIFMAEQAVKLFKQGNAQPRRLLLITDGIEQTDIEKTSGLLKENNIELSILAVGTEEGAPMIKPDGQFIKDNQGQIILPGLTMDTLKALQQATNARFSTLQNSDRDVQYLLPDAKAAAEQQNQQQQTQSEWYDNGHWFALAIVPLLLWLFRRGLIFLVFILMFTPKSDAIDLWQNADQQGQRLLQNNPAQAAQTFHDKRWQATAHYRAGEYQEAANIWQTFKNADDFYNLGNAYAHLQKYQQGIDAYKQALQLKPDWQAAQENKQLLEKLLAEQSKQNQPSKDDSQADSQQNQQGQQSTSDQQQNQQGQQSQSDQQQNQQGQQSNADQTNKSEQMNEQKNNPAQADEKKSDDAKQQKQATAQQDTQQQTQDTNDKEAAAAQATQDKNQPKSEQQEKLDQWLQRVPDDPSGLLRRKFLYQYQNHDQSEQQDRNPW